MTDKPQKRQHSLVGPVKKDLNKNDNDYFIKQMDRNVGKKF